MRSVADFRGWAAQQWRAHWPAWLAASVTDADAEAGAVRWRPLHPPTESVMASDPDAVAAWVQAWQRFERTDGIHVEWSTRAWTNFGTQRLPERATGTPAALARLSGQSETWQRGLEGVARLREVWPDADLTDAIRAQARRLGALDEADVVRLLAVVAWIVANPSTGLWERELPVVGVHTKWLERHRALVEALVSGIAGEEGTGLRRVAVRFRVRALDPTLLPGPPDFSVDLAGLRALDVEPARVLICENATTLGTLPELPRTVALHGMGFAAPVLAEVPWVARADVAYWGDLDTYGFQILGQLRQALPRVESVLMDAGTWRTHEHLAVDEPRPFRGVIGHLTVAELDALALVRQGDRRLEQERIPRAPAAAELASAWTAR
ncbi:MAG TPA: hypothetical protein GXZ60_10205 [Intrasporangiaceae bacterium]|nr:hypothetical protein [Intrasporangiaceae bacterium]